MSHSSIWKTNRERRVSTGSTPERSLVRSPFDLLALQRMVGNRAIAEMLTARSVRTGRGSRISDVRTADARSLVVATSGPARLAVQRTPQDIEKQYEFDLAAPPRAAERDAAIAGPINTLVERSIIAKPAAAGGKGPKFVGAHLWKAEYGGPDDETNVVPWTPKVEQEFSKFETRWEKPAGLGKWAKDGDALTGTLTAHTAARFEDRPDVADRAKEAAALANRDADKSLEGLDDLARFIQSAIETVPVAVTASVTVRNDNAEPVETRASLDKALLDFAADIDGEAVVNAIGGKRKAFPKMIRGEIARRDHLAGKPGAALYHAAVRGESPQQLRAMATATDAGKALLRSAVELHEADADNEALNDNDPSDRLNEALRLLG